VLLVALLSVLHLAQVTEFVIKPDRGTLSQAVFAALTFQLNWLEGRQGYLPGSLDILWTLSVEEVFYLAFPLMCLICRRERWLFLPLIALIIVGPLNRAALVGQEPWGEYAYLSCMDGIAFGCLAALLGARLKIPLTIARSLMALGIACALLVVVVRNTAAVLGAPSGEYGVTILELGIALILFSMTQGVARTATLPGTRLIQTVGKGSYEIYLTHMLVVLGLIPLIVKLKPTVSIPIWYFAILVLSVMLGLTVQKFYSELINKLLRASPATGRLG
jgi:peptidoglycan/LPS O-acetylase OafA/YrhL